MSKTVYFIFKGSESIVQMGTELECQSYISGRPEYRIHAVQIGA